MKVLLLLSENGISPKYTLWGDNRQGSFWLIMLYCKQASYAPSSHHIAMIGVVSHDCTSVERLDNVCFRTEHCMVEKNCAIDQAKNQPFLLLDN